MYVQITNIINVFVTIFNPVVEQEPMPNADTIQDPEQFTQLVSQLLGIFPNNSNATQILDPNPNNPFVSKSDAETIATVVPQLRKLLRDTPLEVERREKFAKCKATTKRLTAALDRLAAVFSGFDLFVLR